MKDGNATTKSGESGAKINIAGFTDKLYNEFRLDIIKLIKAFNKVYTKDMGEPLWKNESEIDNFEVFSGSGNSYFKKSREEYTKVKPKIGDIDVQVPEASRDKLKEFLSTHEGQKFNGFTYLGTKYGLDFYNIFKAPSKYNPYATNIQIDLEFNEYDEEGKPNEFDLWAKNSEWEDISKGIKGVAKQELLPCVYKIKYKRLGVLLQPKKDIPAKNQRGGNFNSLSLGPKGSRGHYIPVNGPDGKQLMIDGQPAYRETSFKDTGSNKNVDKIFVELFGHEPDKRERQLFWSYQGCLQLMKENYTERMINDIYQLYHEHMLDHTDNEEVYNIIMNKFKEFFPYVYTKNEKMNFNKYLKMNLIRG